MRRDYAEGDWVNWKWGGLKGIGRIRGIASRGLVDYWIVEPYTQLTQLDDLGHKWSCITVAHTVVTPTGVDPSLSAHEPSKKEA